MYNKTVKVLDVEVLPAQVLAGNASQKVSENYDFVSTKGLIDIAAEHGLVPINATVARSRNVEDAIYAKHAIRLAPAELITDQTTLVDLPTINIINSHDGKHAIQFLLGYYRLVCANGMIAGQTIDSYRHRHIGLELGQLHQTFLNLIKKTPDLIAQVDAMKTKLLSNDQIQEFSEFAFSARFDSETIEKLQEERPRLLEFYRRAMNYVRRNEDKNNDLWTVFNRIQENTVRGIGRRGFSAVKSIDRLKDLNQDLWDHAIKIAA